MNANIINNQNVIKSDPAYSVMTTGHFPPAYAKSTAMIAMKRMRMTTQYPQVLSFLLTTLTLLVI